MQKIISTFKKALKTDHFRCRYEKINGYTLIDKDNDVVMDISYDIDELPFCCGIRELGNLEYFSKPNLPEQVKKDFISYVFLNIVNSQIKNKKGKVVTARGLIICSNGKGGWKHIEPVLNTTLCENFISVSTTRNPQSSNIINVYAARY